MALESTIITHGMPYPENVETALEIEEIIREIGAEPATIAIIDGKIKVGLSRDEIKSWLAETDQELKRSAEGIWPGLHLWVNMVQRLSLERWLLQQELELSFL